MSIFFDIWEQYGWTGIVGILFCMGLFILIRKIGNKISDEMTTGLEKVGEKLTDQMSKQNDQLINMIASQQDKMVDYLINKEADDKAAHSNMINERMTLAEDINMKLKDIMNTHNAQHAFVLEFHNSYQNLSGVPFAKYSCNYEWFDKGLLPFGNRCIGLPFGSIARVVQDVLKSDDQQIIYTDMNKLEEDNPSLAYLIHEKAKTIIYTGMHDNKNMLIGLLVLEYHTDVDVNKINRHQISIQAAELTSMLNIRYKYVK